MNAENPFIYLILLSAGLAIFIYIRMLIFLHRRGFKLGLFQFRLMIPYISKYKAIYAQEKAAGVNLFPYWLVCINAALLFAVLLALTI